MKNSMVYYAHSMCIYNTERERRELKFLSSIFRSVLNPNDYKDSAGMGFFLNLVSECGIVVCSEYKRFIGKGVFMEINSALKSNKQVFCLRNTRGRWKLLEVKRVKVYDVTDWAVKYGKVIL